MTKGCFDTTIKHQSSTLERNSVNAGTQSCQQRNAFMPTKRLKSKKTLKDKGFPVTFSSDKRRRDSQLINKRKLNMKQMIVKNNWSRLGGILLLCLFALIPFSKANAQKFALVDMDYVLKNIPAYERANEQLNQVSKKWQAEVEALNTEAATMYKNYQNEMVFLSQEQKKAKQEQIMQKEKEAADLKQKYFGPEGELFKKRESLMTPIQEEIYNAVKDISELRGYSLVLDRASDTAIIFGSPKIDISDEVLQKLGYGK